jgi:hypothetical protein
MKLTKELIRQYVGEDAKISERWFADGFRVRTPTGEFLIDTDGSEITFTSGGPEIQAAAIKLFHALGWKSLVVSGNVEDAMYSVIAGQALGMEIRAGPGSSRWLGLETPAPPIPPRSYAHGSARRATDDEVAAAKLTGAQWGDGIRIGYDSSGNIMRYLGENSLVTFGAPGTGKFTDLIAPAMIEYGANIRRGGPGASCVIVDQKGQISAVTIAERRKLGEVIPLYPFTEGLPAGLTELLGPTSS